MQEKMNNGFMITLIAMFFSLAIYVLYLHWIKHDDKVTESPNKVEYQPGDVVETLVHDGYFIISYSHDLNKTKQYIVFSTVVCQDVEISEVIIHRKVDKKVLLEAPKLCTFKPS